MARTLYICYFGLRQPLVQTQVIPYLLEIAKDGAAIELLTFEPGIKKQWTPESIDNQRRELRKIGIEWHLLPYHKRPSALATLYDIFRGTCRIRRLVKRKKIDILHCRVHVPMLMGTIARKTSRNKPKLLFDIRGFFPEEYTDAGVWPENGWIYKTVKRIERWLMCESDAFVLVAEKARDILFPEARETGSDVLGRPVEVIPCCVDFVQRFAGTPDILRAEYRERLGIADRYVVIHVGALGGLYLTEEIADILSVLKEANAKTFALFLTQSEPQKIVSLLEQKGFSERDFLVTKVPAADVQGYLEASDVGLSLVKASYSTLSRSPTKIPEYLACGLPVIANRGVGDVDELIEQNKVGVLIDDFSKASYLKAFAEVEALGNIDARCRETARSNFDLELIGGKRYRRIYSRLCN